MGDAYCNKVAAPIRHLGSSTIASAPEAAQKPADVPKRRRKSTRLAHLQSSCPQNARALHCNGCIVLRTTGRSTKILRRGGAAQRHHVRIVSPSTHKPGYPKVLAQPSTSVLNCAMSALPASPASKSFNFLPFSCCTFKAIWQHRSRNPAIFLKSSAAQPRVVIAGAPMRTPPGDKAEASPCTALRFSVIDAISQTFSSFEPVRPCGRKSQSTKWLSVPSLASLWPFSFSVSARVLALVTTALEYSLKLSVETSSNWA